MRRTETALPEEEGWNTAKQISNKRAGESGIDETVKKMLGCLAGVEKDQHVGGPT